MGSKNVPDCTRILWRGALLTSISSFPFLADQTVLSGTSKDDFSALSGLEMTGLKFLFLCDRKKGIALGSYMENLFKLTDYFVFFIWSFTFFTQVFAKKKKRRYICIRNSLPLARWPTEHKGECLYDVYSCILCHFLCQCLQCFANHVAITHTLTFLFLLSTSPWAGRVTDD